jgi:hypothetical protein
MPPSTTERACVALTCIESADYILNDFRFFGCLLRSNYPLHITICFIDSEFQTTQSPPRSTEPLIPLKNFMDNFNEMIFDFLEVSGLVYLGYFCLCMVWIICHNIWAISVLRMVCSLPVAQ